MIDRLTAWHAVDHDVQERPDEQADEGARGSQGEHWWSLEANVEEGSQRLAAALLELWSSSF